MGNTSSTVAGADAQPSQLKKGEHEPQPASPFL